MRSHAWCALGAAVLSVLSGRAAAQVAVTGEDRARAAELSKGCDGKVPAACFDLARMHWAGKVTGWIDDRSGLEAFRKAFAGDREAAIASRTQRCEGNDGEACDNLGSLYLLGEAAARDDGKAVGFFERACSLGCLRGCSDLGGMVGSSDAVKLEKALEVLGRACDGGDALGCSTLAGLYLAVPSLKDLRKSVAFAERACASGHRHSCVTVGGAYAFAKGFRDVPRGVALLEKACAAGDGQGCGMLGSVHAFAEGMKDPRKARAYLEKGCELRDPDACHNLGAMYARGIPGVPRDDGRAMRVFQRTCDRGNPQGCTESRPGVRGGARRSPEREEGGRAVAIGVRRKQRRGVPAPRRCLCRRAGRPPGPGQGRRAVAHGLRRGRGGGLRRAQGAPRSLSECGVGAPVKQGRGAAPREIDRLAFLPDRR